MEFLFAISPLVSGGTILHPEGGIFPFEVSDDGNSPVFYDWSSEFSAKEVSMPFGGLRLREIRGGRNFSFGEIIGVSATRFREAGTSGGPVIPLRERRDGGGRGTPQNNPKAEET
jgi:hypothetical protein